jgi:preprotein translocase subunit SecB
MENLQDNSAVQSTPTQQFAIQKLYVKHINFDIPNAPVLFKKTEQPKINFELEISSDILEEKNHYDVTLKVTTHVIFSEEEKAFDIMVKQSGIFLLEGYNSEQIDQLLNNYCPSILFPYIREVISDIAIRGGFMPLVLAPINFDALYAQKKQKEQEQNNLSVTYSDSFGAASQTIQ